MKRDIIYGRTARDDLKAIFDWIDDAGVASAYLDRIHARCDQLATFADRGTPRDDLVPGLRTIGFERKATIVYLVEARRVRIMRVLHKGRDIRRSLKN